MKFNAMVYVSLKRGYSDPEGETAANALRGLGYDVLDVRTSKAYDVVFEAEDKDMAKVILDEMCKRLLTNPTKDDYIFEIRKEK